MEIETLAHAFGLAAIVLVMAAHISKNPKHLPLFQCIGLISLAIYQTIEQKYAGAIISVGSSITLAYFIIATERLRLSAVPILASKFGVAILFCILPGLYIVEAHLGGGIVNYLPLIKVFIMIIAFCFMTKYAICVCSATSQVIYITYHSVDGVAIYGIITNALVMISAIIGFYRERNRLNSAEQPKYILQNDVRSLWRS